MNAAMDIISKDQSGFLYTICRSLPDLTGRLTVRTDGGHAPPLS